MYNGKRILAVIPARSGSKGLPDKNIKLLNGKPLMAYTIETALAMKEIDEVFVSTDSIGYQRIAEEFGASVPFLRSEALASDSASTWDAVQEAIEQYKKQDEYFDIILVLQPTSPLRTLDDILKVLIKMAEEDADLVVTVCETNHSPLWSNELPENGGMKNFIREEVKGKRRQDLPIYYQINGAVYAIKTEYLLNNSQRDLYNEYSYAVVMDKRNSVDIDDAIDFEIAGELMKYSL